MLCLETGSSCWSVNRESCTSSPIHLTVVRKKDKLPLKFCIFFPLAMPRCIWQNSACFGQCFQIKRTLKATRCFHLPCHGFLVPTVHVCVQTSSFGLPKRCKYFGWKFNLMHTCFPTEMQEPMFGKSQDGFISKYHLRESFYLLPPTAMWIF